MPDQQPQYLAEALARFRAAADAAVERGRRTADDARAASAVFQRDSERVITRLRESIPDPGATATAPDLREAAAEYRAARGLPLPDMPDDAGDAPDDHARRPPPPPEDEDFSQFRIMRPL